MTERIERYKSLIERFMNLTIADIKRFEMVEGNDFQLCSNLTTVILAMGKSQMNNSIKSVLEGFLIDNEELNGACGHVIINDTFDMVDEIHESYEYCDDDEQWSSEEA